MLDLPVDASGSMLNHWLIQAAAVAGEFGLDKLPARVLLARNSLEPKSAAARFAGACSLGARFIGIPGHGRRPCHARA